MSNMTLLLLLLLSCLLPLTVLGQQQQRSLVLVGGALADDNELIYGRFVELAGGVGVARIGIVTAASADPLSSAIFYKNIFAGFGALETYWVPVHEANLGAAFDPDVVNEVNRMTGFFFGGGDQARVLTSLFQYDNLTRVETPVMTALRLRHESGSAVVGGSSAGTTALTGAVMMAEGLSYEALKFGAFATTEDNVGLINYLLYDADGGIGLLPNYVLDTHFSERGRQGRLIRLLSDTKDLTHGAPLGLGVDENTALVVMSNLDGSNAVGEIIGDSGVYFVDVRQSIVGQINEQWSIKNVITHYLRHGDSIDLDTWSVIDYASYKINLEGNENYADAITTDDIFGESELTAVAKRLMNSEVYSTWGTTIEKRPIFKLDFVKAVDTVGFGGYIPGSPAKFDVSYQNLVVNVQATE